MVVEMLHFFEIFNCYFLTHFIRGEKPPSHSISAILISHDHNTLVTGGHDGQLCVWTMDPSSFKVYTLYFNDFCMIYWGSFNMVESIGKSQP
jgi:WD40 repeat protein